MQSTSKVQASTLPSEPKARGANRSTKVAGKLKVLPEQPESPVTARKLVLPSPKDQDTTGDSDEGDIDGDTEDQEDVEVYNQISLIPDGTARRDALRLTKKKAKSLLRVTAYATASSYRFPELMKFFNARKTAYHTSPKLIDEVIYTPYVYDPPSTHSEDTRASRKSNVLSQNATGDLLGIPELQPEGETDGGWVTKKKSKFDTTSTQADIFLFEYGTVVIWGMTEAQEKRFLSSMCA